MRTPSTSVPSRWGAAPSGRDWSARPAKGSEPVTRPISGSFDDLLAGRAQDGRRGRAPGRPGAVEKAVERGVETPPAARSSTCARPPSITTRSAWGSDAAIASAAITGRKASSLAAMTRDGTEMPGKAPRRSSRTGCGTRGAAPPDPFPFASRRNPPLPADGAARPVRMPERGPLLLGEAPRAQPLGSHQHRLDPGLRLRRGDGPAAGEDGRTDAVGPPLRQPHGDDAAEREPDHRRPGHAERLQKRRHVLGIEVDGIGRVGLLVPAHAAQVGRDRKAAGRRQGLQLRGPRDRRHSLSP